MGCYIRIQVNPVRFRQLHAVRELTLPVRLYQLRRACNPLFLMTGGTQLNQYNRQTSVCESFGVKVLISLASVDNNTRKKS